MESSMQCPVSSRGINEPAPLPQMCASSTVAAPQACEVGGASDFVVGDVTFVPAGPRTPESSYGHVNHL